MKKISRRKFLKLTGLGITGLTISACQPTYIKAINTPSQTPFIPTATVENSDVQTIHQKTKTPKPTPTFSPEQLPQLLSEDEKEFIATHGIREGDASRPVVMMTYDDNGKYDQIRTILDAFNKHPGAKATFFFLGEKITLSSKAVRAVVKEGHLLACHAWEHISLMNLNNSQLHSAFERCFQAVQEIVPVYRLRYIRFPYGSGVNDPRILRIAAEWGMQHVFWTMCSGGLTDDTYQTVTKNVENGSIVLSHMFRHYDVLQAENIVDKLIADGYSLETIHTGKKPEDTYSPPIKQLYKPSQKIIPR